MVPSVNMNKGTTYEPRIACYVRRSTFPSRRIAVPYQEHQITLINNPVTSRKIRIVGTILKWQAMNILTTLQQAVILIKGFSSGEYFCIFGARDHHLCRNA